VSKPKKENRELLNGGLSIGTKLFEEVDKPTGSKIVFEDKDKGIVEREKAPGLVILKDITPFLQERPMAQDARISWQQRHNHFTLGRHM
jgi:hypothetical protein